MAVNPPFSKIACARGMRTGPHAWQAVFAGRGHACWSVALMMGWDVRSAGTAYLREHALRSWNGYTSNERWHAWNMAV
jgi:hypothetical protein